VDPSSLEGVASAYRYKLTILNPELFGSTLNFTPNCDVFSFHDVDKKRALKKEEWPSEAPSDNKARLDVQIRLMAGTSEIVTCEGCAMWKEKTSKPFLVLTPTGTRCVQYSKKPFILLIFRCCPKFHSCSKAFRLIITMTSPLNGTSYCTEIDIYRKRFVSNKKRKMGPDTSLELPVQPQHPESSPQKEVVEEEEQQQQDQSHLPPVFSQPPFLLPSDIEPPNLNIFNTDPYLVPFPNSSPQFSLPEQTQAFSNPVLLSVPTPHPQYSLQNYFNIDSIFSGIPSVQQEMASFYSAPYQPQYFNSPSTPSIQLPSSVVPQAQPQYDIPVASSQYRPTRHYASDHAVVPPSLLYELLYSNNGKSKDSVDSPKPPTDASDVNPTTSKPEQPSSPVLPASFFQNVDTPYSEVINDEKWLESLFSAGEGSIPHFARMKKEKAPANFQRRGSV